MLEIQDVRIDGTSRRVWRGDREIQLSRMEFDLLYRLARSVDEIVSRRELMRDVWRREESTATKTIDVHVGWVRRKLGDDPRSPTLITTVRGHGLRMVSTPPG